MDNPWQENNRRGINLAQVRCSELKESWEIYHRQLDGTDAVRGPLAKVQSAQSRAYFSLYNRSTGVLRSFLWVDANAATTGQVFLLTAQVTRGAGDVAATKLLDFYKAEALENIEGVNSPTEFTWVIPRPTNQVWLVTDLVLMYDPQERNLQDGYEEQLHIRYDLDVRYIADIALQGEWSGELTTITTSTSDVSMLGIGKSAINTGRQVHSSSKDLGGWIERQLNNENGPLKEASTTLRTGLRKFANIVTDYGSTGGIVDGLIQGGIGLFDKFFSNETTTTEVSFLDGTIALQGTITARLSATGFSIPYSGSIRGEAPLFAYKYPQESMRKLGLFHLLRQPKITHKGSRHVEEMQCLLAMNPNARTQKAEFLQSRMQNVTEEWMGTTGFFLEVEDSEQANRRESRAVFSLHAKTGVLGNSSTVLPLASFEEVRGYTLQEKPYCMDSWGLPLRPEEFPEQYAIGAAKRLKLNDRSCVVNSFDEALEKCPGHESDRFAWRTEPGVNAVAGGGVYAGEWVELGVESSIGTVVGARVNLRDRSRVRDALFVGGLSKQNQVVHPPQLPFLREYAPRVGLGFFNPPGDNPSLSSTEQVFAAFPSVEARRNECVSSTQDWNILISSYCQQQNAVNHLHLPVGFYNEVVIRAGAHLHLTTGHYAINNLIMESDAMLSIAGPTVITIGRRMLWRGNPVNVNPEKLMVAVIGAASTAITRPFHGTVIAPAGTIVLGDGRQETYYGRFYAAQMEVHQDTRVVRVPFSWN